MATPLVRIPQQQGGTLYAFASGAKDLTKAYYNPDLVFQFSKYALLDLPVVSSPSPGSTNNYIQFSNLYDSSGNPYNDTLVDDANIHWAQTFQNYALNLENFILTDDDFDSDLYQSDSEKIFFKWLNHIGAFRVRSATQQEAVIGLSRFVEENNSTGTGSEYTRVIKYLGNIDVTNDKNYLGQSYNEIFINVPVSVGNTPDILLSQTVYNTTASTYSPSSTINGRAGQTHPDINLNMIALADSADGSINIDPNITYSYGIDWDSANYTQIVNDPELGNLQDFAKRGADFRFNAVLVYYDIFSKSTGIKNTNLYGIMILDNWKQDPSTSGWYIPEITKYKPNEITGLNGNGFGLKLNLKFNSSLDNVGVEVNVDSSSVLSMDIFMNTTSTIEKSARLMQQANDRYLDISNRLDALENLLWTVPQSQQVQDQILQLQQQLNNATLNYASSESLSNQIVSLNNRINSILNNETPLRIQYDTTVIKSGKGIKIDRDGNRITINNSDIGYNLLTILEYDSTSNIFGDIINQSNPFDIVVDKAIYFKINDVTGFAKIWIDEFVLIDSNVNIYIDDSQFGWQLGQIVKFTFKNKLNLNGFNIKIWSNKNNGWEIIKNISESDLISQKPYFELICIDSINKIFEVEIIR